MPNKGNLCCDRKTPGRKRSQEWFPVHFVNRTVTNRTSGVFVQNNRDGTVSTILILQLIFIYFQVYCRVMLRLRLKNTSIKKEWIFQGNLYKNLSPSVHRPHGNFNNGPVQYTNCVVVGGFLTQVYSGGHLIESERCLERTTACTRDKFLEKKGNVPRAKSLSIPAFRISTFHRLHFTTFAKTAGKGKSSVKKGRSRQLKNFEL